MDRHHSTAPPRARPSRAERKQETRDALILAARVAFARDGYHGANLEGIANEAGFSKGAVYSNFEGKAELFLAVMDDNLQVLRGDAWDPFAVVETTDTCKPEPGVTPDQEAAEMVRGLGLATLEFVATAARDETLIHSLRARVQVLIDAYERVAASGRTDGDPLPVEAVAQLMAALDQGISVLALSGVASIDGALMRAGLRRLIDPADAATEPAPATEDVSWPLPDVQEVRRLLHDTGS
ncbi:TetR/AcrR family transcriptional regulator [Phytoactinopolyspora mesophila]|uniref:TetR family transcriptional regulator n=1 Tax=Phytoactinopolyspora mesophila TaxID=2650750 RepID=A0A7K3M0V1_9ACTN|nr:TetR/AcrR family transcriptional regulator [Phytoactinopolyspora mesophila]NDL56522.1 TetR family transcriptional regulator [Phytoactinopolyspora mesophila]